MNPTPVTGSLCTDSGQAEVPEAFLLSSMHALHWMKPKHLLEAACLLRRSANHFQPGVCLSVGAGIVAPIAIMAGA